MWLWQALCSLNVLREVIKGEDDDGLTKMDNASASGASTSADLLSSNTCNMTRQH